MIDVSTTARSVLSGSYRYYLNVESWLAGGLLADDVPVDEAGEEVDRGLRVPERAVLSVPLFKDGVSWSPDNDIHPLAANGQRLHVKLGIGIGQGVVEWFARGRYLIQESEVDGDVVRVSAVGMLALIDEARLISPYQPTGTLVSTLRGLIEPALTVLVDGSLSDRSVPSSINYDEDRLGAVHELLDAWPATAYVDPTGYLRATAPTQSTTPVATLTDTGGTETVIAVGGNSRRDGAYNAVVARGTQASDGAQIQGVAYLQTGPKSFSGPFNPLPVPFFFASPLLATIDQCNQAASTIRDRKARENAREYRVQLVPNPTLQAGDVVALTSTRLGLAAVPCSIESLSLPWKAARGGRLPAMVLTCRTLA